MAGIVHQLEECTTASTSLEHSPRAVGGGLPASSSPLPLPLALNTDRGLSFSTLDTQTDISVDPSHNFVTFSAKTFIELLPLLSDEQLNFEIRYNNEILKRNVDFKSTRKSSVNKIAKIEALSKTLSPVLIDKFEDTFTSVKITLISPKNSISEAKQFLDELKKTCGKAKDIDEAEEVFYDCPSSELELPVPVCVFDFILGEGLEVSDFTRRGVAILESRSRRANGVHITYQATNEIRGVIACCLNAWCSGELSVVSDEWPLRPEFRHIAENNK